MQHRKKTQVGGRHRRTAPLHSHRAPSTPFAERGRYALVTAALVGVGVTAAAGATPAASHPRMAAQPATAQLGLPAPTDPQHPAAATWTAPQAAPAASAPAATPAPASGATAGLPGTASTTAASAGTARAFAPGRHKPRPAPAPKPAVRKMLTGKQAKLGKLTRSGNRTKQSYKARHAAAPKWVNPMPEGMVTSCFGPRWGRLHAGVDLAAPHGTRVRTVGAGTVVTAGVEGGYGNAVLIDHGNGYLTHYGHLSVITVQAGQRVRASEQIGNEGSTGHSTGPHLHFEVHQGTYRNPVEPTGWMQARGAVIPGCVAVRVDQPAPGRRRG